MGRSEKVMVVGASGFGRECLDVLEAMKSAGEQIDICGVIDDSPSERNLARLAQRGIAYLGTTENWLTKAETDIRFLVGIGNPQIRRRLAELLEGRGLTAFTAVHPSAGVGSRAQLQAGVVVCGGAQISTNVRLGRHAHVNPSAVIGHDSVLDDFVSVNPAAVISGEVAVGRETLIGAGAVVLQGLVVGAGTVVGAAACVTKDLPAGAVAVGIPARPIETGRSL